MRLWIPSWRFLFSVKYDLRILEFFIGLFCSMNLEKLLDFLTLFQIWLSIPLREYRLFISIHLMIFCFGFSFKEILWEYELIEVYDGMLEVEILSEVRIPWKFYLSAFHFFIYFFKLKFEFFNGQLFKSKLRELFLIPPKFYSKYSSLFFTFF